MDQTVKMLNLSGSEMALYHSGQRRGHAECLKQIAGQLREAANAQKKLIDDGTEYDEDAKVLSLPLVPQAVEAAYNQFADQLDGPAAQASKEQHELLDKYLDAKQSERTFARKLKDAIDGAVGGWKG